MNLNSSLIIVWRAPFRFNPGWCIRIMFSGVEWSWIAATAVSKNSSICSVSGKSLAWRFHPVGTLLIINRLYCIVSLLNGNVLPGTSIFLFHPRDISGPAAS